MEYLAEDFPLIQAIFKFTSLEFMEQHTDVDLEVTLGFYYVFTTDYFFPTVRKILSWKDWVDLLISVFVPLDYRFKGREQCRGKPFAPIPRHPEGGHSVGTEFGG